MRAALLALVLSGCAPKAVKVGLVLPAQGEMAALSTEVREGATMALDEYVAGGGKARLIDIPGGCDAEATLPAVEAAVEEGTVLLVGELCSGATVAIAERFGDGKAVLVAPIATDPAVTVGPAGVRPSVFRVVLTDAQLGAAAAKFARGPLEAGSAAVIAGSQPYAQRQGEAFAAAFEAAGGRVVLRGESGEAALDELMAIGADVVFLPDPYDQVAPLAVRAREKGISAVFLGGDAWDSESLDRVALDGAYYAIHWAPGDPLEADWAKRFEARWGHPPSGLSTMGYEAASELFAGVGAAGSAQPGPVSAAMSARGSFDAAHDPVYAAVILQVTPQGDVRMGPIDPALPR